MQSHYVLFTNCNSSSLVALSCYISESAVIAMSEGLKEICRQNSHLLNCLMSTKGKSLVKANPQDTDWSSGISLKHSHKLLNIKSWSGKNELGNALDKIRDIFDV